MKFSFIIPAKNEEQALSLLLKSILSQNFDTRLLEILVIDDYSIDGTSDVAKKLGATVLTPNLPPGKTSRAYNKNFAVNFSRGDFLVFLDAHIILPSENWLSNVALLIERTNLTRNLFFASFPAVPPPELTPLLNIFSRETVKGISLALRQANKKNQFVGGCMVISRDAFTKLGGFPEIPASEDVGLHRTSLVSQIPYFFNKDLWVWHLDRKLQSAKCWLKRNLKEGYLSTAFSWEYSGKFDKLYSFLLGTSLLAGFLFPLFWYVALLLVLFNISLQVYRGVVAMRLSNGEMTAVHLLILVSLKSMQALMMRISAALGMLPHFFHKMRKKLI